MDGKDEQSSLNPTSAPPQLPPVRCRIAWALIVSTSAAWILAGSFIKWGVPPGAEVGMKTLGGEWWRLLTAMFVHVSLVHLAVNLFFLWFFGKRMEAILGGRTFLFFYLCCGLAGNIVTLAILPEAASYGASGAVCGLAGGLLAAYGMKVKQPSLRQRWKLALLAVWIAWTIYGGFSDPEINNAAHLGGLVAGLALGAVLVSSSAETAKARRFVFAGSALVLLVGGIWIRYFNRYVVHVDAADRALDQGHLEDASRELHIAVQLKPNSDLARKIVHQLEEKRGPKDGCSTLRAGRSGLESNTSVCSGKECDGEVHARYAPDGTRISYEGIVETHRDEGVSQITTTATLTKQALDEFDEIACTIRTTDIAKQKLDSNGILQGIPIVVQRTVQAVLDSDLEAIDMRKQALRSRR